MPRSCLVPASRGRAAANRISHPPSPAGAGVARCPHGLPRDGTCDALYVAVCCLHAIHELRLTVKLLTLDVASL
jgi:hypothetical protein